jgi:hypothetical protein
LTTTAFHSLCWGNDEKTPTTFEHTPENKGISASFEKGAAKSDAFSTENPKFFDPDLAKIIEAWPALPDHIREAILSLVGTAK